MLVLRNSTVVFAIVMLLTTTANAIDRMNYDELIDLDAETLAEQGIAAAYGRIKNELLQIRVQPVPIAEDVRGLVFYSVIVEGKEYVIYSRYLEQGMYQHWGRATHAFFEIVNSQMEGLDHRFYAVNAGNDLFGFFLTDAELKAARSLLSNRQDWPYLPTTEGPWFGMFH